MNTPNTQKQRRFDREKGYTLFEIMLVLGIISVLVGAAIYMLVGNVDMAKIQRVEADFQSINTQLKGYEMMNYNFPTTEQGLEALVKKPTIEPVPRKWIALLQVVPQDPWGNPYHYANPGKKNSKGFDLYSFGPDKKESEDDIYFSTK